jgi:hypothetical protein
LVLADGALSGDWRAILFIYFAKVPKGLLRWPVPYDYALFPFIVPTNPIAPGGGRKTFKGLLEIKKTRQRKKPWQNISTIINSRSRAFQIQAKAFSESV